jgi:hypothetical protein
MPRVHPHTPCARLVRRKSELMNRFEQLISKASEPRRN